MLLALLGAVACAQPLMSVPTDLASNVDIYPVSGHQGFLLFNPPISFGPYRTTSLHRGVSGGEHSSTPTGVFSSQEHDTDRQSFDFVLQGPMPGAWRVRCLAYSEQRSETHVTGVQFGSEGTGLTHQETPISSASGYRCQLDGPAAEHWTLETDETLSSGTVSDEAGRPVVDIQDTRERGTSKHPPLEGNLLVGTDPGETWAAVQRSFDGAVYLSRTLDARRKMAAAAICTALLINGR